MTRSRCIALILALLVGPAGFAPAIAQSDRAALANAYPEIDRVMRAYADDNHVPGAAWGIIVDGELVHSGAAGVRDVESRVPVDVDTVFRIASMTKSFTAMAIMKLRDHGRLSLDDPAERYVPEMGAWRYPTSDSPRITIRHLLSHAAGLPEDNPWGDRQLADTEEQLSAMLRAGAPFSNAPGLAYEYSNLAFAILGRVVSRVSGVPYPAYIRANILQPLGMTSSWLEPSEVPPLRLAHGFRWEDGTWRPEPMLSHGSFGSMGGMLTSVRDLSRYVSAFLAAWPARDGPETLPITRASLREMQQMWRADTLQTSRNESTGLLEATAGAYGFGLRVSKTTSYGLLVEHGGGLPGFGSTMRWLPEQGVGFVAVGNLTYARLGRIAPTVTELLARSGGFRTRSPQPSIALVAAKEDVSRLVLQWDEALADRIAAGNLFLDRSRDRRRAEIDQLRQAVGTCTLATQFAHVENALRGRWVLPCERGGLEVTITLAPTSPPTVQFLSVRQADGAINLDARIGELHKGAIVIDTHIDTTAFLARAGWDFAARHNAPTAGAGNSGNAVDLPRMRDGGLDAAFFSIFIPGTVTGPAAVKQALAQIDAVRGLTLSHPSEIVLATTAADVRAAQQSGRIAALMGVEGGHMIDDDLAVLRTFHALGVRYLTLSHATNTNWSDSSGDKPVHNGLTEVGKDVVRELNRLGMMVDVSHVSDKTFWDALAVSQAPLLASHSSSRTLSGHPRNMTDEMIKAMAAKGGVVQVNFADQFLDGALYEASKAHQAELDLIRAAVEAKWPGQENAQRRRPEVQAAIARTMKLPVASWERIVDHIDHIAKLVGPTHVGIGSDFDGATLPVGMEDVTHLPQITARLVDRGYSDDDIRNILGGNVLRLMEQVDDVGRRLRAAGSTQPAPR